MLKTRLMTAAATVALFAAPAAFAQEAPTPQPTTPPADSATAAVVTPGAQENSVVAVLRADGRFTTLLSALDAAELTAVLEAQPAVSIFAPTDEAFAALPEADRTRLMDPANREELRSLLLYHVIAADVQSSQITGARGGVPTAGGAQVQLDGTGDAIKIDDATVVTADIDASNGAIFAIDKVLTPSASQAAMGDEEEVAPATAPAAATTPSATTTSATTSSPAPTSQSDQADEATAADQPPVEAQEPISDDAAADAAAGDDATPPAGEQTDEEPTDPQA